MFNKAIVIGGTGATGRQLVKKLLINNNFKKITTIGRRPILNGKKHPKIDDIVIDNFNDFLATKGLWKGHNIFFNCIGTTIKRAENSKEFKNIEVNISENAAKLALEGNVRHVSIISANGANENQWSRDWIHPLYYLKIMGQKEQTVLSKKFKSTSIFRPGMLLRLMKKKSIIDKYLIKSGLGLPVDLLASAMIADAENSNQFKGFNNNPKIFVGNKNIKAILKNKI